MGQIRLVEPRAEVSVLKTICEADETSLLMVSRLKSDHFGYPAAAYVFRYIKDYYLETQSIPTWDNVCSDMQNNKEVRKVVRHFRKASKHPNRKAAMQGVDIIIEYYRARVLTDVINHAAESLESDAVNIESLYKDLMSELVAASMKKDVVPKYVMGTGNNSAQLVKTILKGETLPAIPTGIEAWDSRNRGIFRGTVFTMAATSGAGKSAIANHVAIQMARAGCRVGYVSLEMSEEEMYMRTLSNISDVPLSNFVMGNLSAADKKQAQAAYKKYVKDLQAKEAQYSLYVPQEDMTGEELLMMMQPSNFDVIFLDYLTLLKGTDGDDQWKALGSIARYGKRYAEANNCVIVLLAQLSEDTGKIRYARAVREHSGVMWTWSYEPEEREDQIINIIPQKARNQDMSPFKLRENYKYMRVEHYVDEESEGGTPDSYSDLDDELDGYDAGEELL